MRACAALVTVSDPLLMDCALARYRPLLTPCQAPEGSHAGAAWYEGDSPVLIREPVAAGAAGLRFPARILSRQLFAGMVSGARPFRAEDTPPFRFRSLVMVVSGALEAAAGPASRLAIPLHISRNVAGNTVAEQLLHQFASFLWPSRDLPLPQQLNAFGEALRATLTLEDHWFSSDLGRDLAVIIGDGRRAVGATLNRPLWFERLQGLESCTACGGDPDGQPLRHATLRCTAVVDAPQAPGPGWTALEQNRLFLIPRPGDIEVSRL
ncbi:MAG: hypothetical protein FJ098_17160 [Deltaproteobacteria bacterium]|nr:hypothetical protein [Deltaproteobacteria bacterium]